MDDSQRSRAFGRSLEDFEPLSSAERTLLVSCAHGQIAEIQADLPKRGTKSNRVRASFLRFLALGGDASTAIHEHGIRVRGAWITGVLDLESCRVVHAIFLAGCRLERLEAY